MRWGSWADLSCAQARRDAVRGDAVSTDGVAGRALGAGAGGSQPSPHLESLQVGPALAVKGESGRLAGERGRQGSDTGHTTARDQENKPEERKRAEHSCWSQNQHQNLHSQQPLPHRSPDSGHHAHPPPAGGSEGSAEWDTGSAPLQRLFYWIRFYSVTNEGYIER